MISTGLASLPDYQQASLNKDDVKSAAQGQWDSILPNLGVPSKYLKNRHGSCPACGGENRFRYDNRNGQGDFICSQGGGELLAGDGFDLLAHVHGWDFKEALVAVAPKLGLGPEVTPPTQAELEQRREAQKERKRREEAERQRRAGEAAQKAQQLWEAASPAAPSHPYLALKGVRPVTTLRELEADRVQSLLGYAPKERCGPLKGRLLVAPVKVGGNLTTVELIDGEGRKSAIAGGAKAGGWWATGPLPEAKEATVLIGEGVATVLSASEAIGHPGVAALADNNMPNVAKAFRGQYPDADLIILADLNKQTGEPDVKAIEAARAVHGRLAVPNFGPERSKDDKDFNDLARIHGPEAVQETLVTAGLPSQADDTDSPGEHPTSEPPDPPWRNAETPPDWRVSAKGVWREGDDGNKDWLALAPVWVTALTRNPQGGGWGGVVRWLDRDGDPQERAIPFSRFHEQGNTLAQELADDGLAIIPGKERKLAQYLGSCWPEARVRSMERLGWIDEANGALGYVQPNRVITAGGDEEVVYQPDQHSPTARTIHASGTLEDWKTHVAEPCRGNPALIFAICAGLAAPLLRGAELESGGFHLYGATMTGKTTWLQIAASVVGSGADPAQTPDTAFIRRWNATGNGIEALASAHNDAPLCLDEVGTCSAKDFGTVLYNVAGGQGKAAMSRTRDLKPPRAWRTLLLSTGELATAAKVAEGGQAVRGGQQVRIADLALEKIIAESHSQKPDDFADGLKRACGRTYGTAGPSLVAYLVEQSEDAYELRNTVTALLDKAVHHLTPDGTPAEQRRVIRRFALTLVAGWAARRAGVVPFDDEAMEQAVQFVMGQWLASTETQSEAERGMEAVRAFIHRHGARFQAKSADQEVRDRVGYRDEANDLYLFTEAGFQEACGGHDPKVIARELSWQGLLYRNDPERNKSKHQIGTKRPSFYAVWGTVLNEETQNGKN